MAQEQVVWGIHMTGVRDDAPIIGNYIAIGWRELGDPSRIAPNRSAFKAAYATTYPSSKPGTIPVSAGSIFRFIHEMNVGEIVVYPSRHNRMINIGRVTGEHEYVQSPGEEYPNRRSVEWLRHVSREQFPQSALYEIGSAITLFSVTTHADIFLAALAGDVVSNAVGGDDDTAAAIAEQLEESTEDFIIKRLKEAQSSYEFEQFVAHLLQCMGYHARVTKASGDGGVEVIAHRDELGFEPPIIKVQCKQTLGNSGRPDVQKLFGAIEQGEMGLFVTLGSFSPDARVYEQAKSNLRLIDGRTLVELIYTHYEQFSPRYQSLVPLKRTYTVGV
ncbi:MAG: restriction endonuclease [Sphingomonas sp.]|uniref:restriction endonuclease n=1 Tax=Sphingomonas sp. TaxID=28214 RepID=UPI0018164200|nr:restriction endonuclease [Sphingomonas sp.]MBA3667638.1 restriction endonuclease [Sphingomonas sp.]